jgi:UDP-glucose 4-epimerase
MVKMEKGRQDMKMVLLTGAAGFIGSNVAARIMKSGDFVVHGCDNYSFGDKLNVPEGLSMYNRGFEELTPAILSEYEILIHCATSNIIYGMDNPIATFQNNAVRTMELFRQFKGKIIYTSTSSVYGQADVFPTPETAPIRTYNAYDTSKRIAEMYLQQRGNFTTLRLSNVYGHGQRASNPYCGVLGRFLRNSLEGNISLIFGVGDQTRDYTYIDDVVDAIYRALKYPAFETEINIGTGIETSVIELLGLMPWKGTWKHVQERDIDRVKRRCLDISKARTKLQWTPLVKLKDGINKTLDWLSAEKGRDTSSKAVDSSKVKA